VGLYAAGGKILYGRESLCYSRSCCNPLIMAWAQLVIRGRAKVIQGAESVFCEKTTYDSKQSRDCLGLFKYLVWPNNRLIWVVKCLIMAGRS